MPRLLGTLVAVVATIATATAVGAALAAPASCCNEDVAGCCPTTLPLALGEPHAGLRHAGRRLALRVLLPDDVVADAGATVAVHDDGSGATTCARARLVRRGRGHRGVRAAVRVAGLARDAVPLVTVHVGDVCLRGHVSLGRGVPPLDARERSALRASLAGSSAPMATGADLPPAPPGTIVDVRQFGARCDGTGDDTAAIQAAADAAHATCGTVAIPAGTCIVGDGDGAGVRVPSCVTVAGQGATSIVRATPTLGDADLFETAEIPATDDARPSRVVYRDLVLDGSPNRTGREWSMCITLRATVDALIENVQCIAPSGDCFYVGASNPVTVQPLRNTIRNSSCTKPKRNGVSVTAGTAIAIVGNTVEAPGLHGVDVELESSPQRAVRDVTIAANVLSHVNGSRWSCGIALTVDTPGQVLAGATVAENTIATATSGVCLRATSGTVVRDNVIRDVTGVAVASQYGAADVEGGAVAVVGNVIQNVASDGMRWQRPTDVTVVGNVMRGIARMGVRIDDGQHLGLPTSGVVLANRIDGVGPTGTSACVAVDPRVPGLLAANVGRNCRP